MPAGRPDVAQAWQEAPECWEPWLALTSAGWTDLSLTYLSLIQTAFVPRLWESSQLVDATGEPLSGRAGAAESTSEFTLAEYNFALFWAPALQAWPIQPRLSQPIRPLTASWTVIAPP